MRTKTRTTADIKPGMVIRLDFATGDFKQVATVQRGPWPNTRYIVFTDGTGEWFHNSTGWSVARGKTARNTAIRRAGIGSTVDILDATAALFRTYALAA